VFFTKITANRQAQLLRVATVACFVGFAAVHCIPPLPWSFTPPGAVAPFSGAKLGPTSEEFLLPLSTLFLGDLFVGFCRIMPLATSAFA